MQLRPLSKNVLKICILRGLAASIAFTVPIIVTYWQKYGLGLFDIGLLQAIFAISLALLEGPSGYVADRLGRKGAIVLGGFGLLSGVVVYSLASGFYSFLVAELLLAFGISMISGADQALLYDSLLVMRRVSLYRKLWGRAASVEFGVCAVAVALGGLMAGVDLRLPFYAAGVGYLLFIICALLLIEPARAKGEVERGHMREFLKLARYSLVENQRLSWIIVASGISLASIMCAFWMYQPYWHLAGIPLIHFGWLYAGFTVFAGCVAKGAHRLSLGDSARKIFCLQWLALIVSFFILGSYVGLLGPVFMLAHQGVRGLYRVYSSDLVNQEASSEYRATIISIKGMVERAIYAGAFLLVGWYADSYGIQAAHNLLGVGLGLAVYLMLLWAKRRES